MEKREPESVSGLTRRIKNTLESTFTRVWVEGELSNFRLMSSGHAYFVLKDASAQISCAFFSMARRMPPFEVKDGIKVRLSGEISLYEQRGTYQIVVAAMEQAGVGDLMAQFEALKKRLHAEGLFAPERKRPLPMLPQRIGIVTSPTGAAIRDMLNVTRRRFAGLHILIAPARVQGAEAVPEIVAGIEMLNALPEPPDVIIVGRGGGSIEDLWCFNDEAVARAIHASRIPVISAVGHEIDFTIADFVADLRAPTPSAAAELVVGRKSEFEKAVSAAEDRLHNAMHRQIERARARFDLAAGSHVFRQPEALVRQHAQRLDLMSQQMTALLTAAATAARRRLDAAAPRMASATVAGVHDAKATLANFGTALAHAAQTQTANARHRLATLSARLESINPMAVLSRGYALVRLASGEVVTHARQVAPGDVLTTRMQDAEFTSVVAGEKPRRRAPRTADPQYEQPTLL
ncbi:MAG: exodeoxyribonuclease VII large subunit [Kiritimatiellia bacterium]|jgi:exodeoxyribonuclease VII large subunit